MSNTDITEKDKKLAQQCADCTICIKARDKQHGILYMIVKFLEGGVCPACKAYEKVYGRKAHEPIPTS